MNDIQQKIAKTSKVVAIVLKVGFILIAIAMGMLLLGMVILGFSNTELSQSLQQTFNITVQNASAVGIAVRNLVMVFGLGMIELAIIFMIFRTMYKIFRAISLDHTPFRSENAKSMKKIAILIIVMGLVDSVASFLADKLLGPQADFGIDFMWLVMAAVIYCIALIFDYGCQLQQQSDETL